MTANGWIYGESAILDAGVRASHDRSPLACFSLTSWSNRSKRDDGPPDYANALSSVPWCGLVCKRYIRRARKLANEASEDVRTSRNLKRVGFRSQSDLGIGVLDSVHVKPVVRSYTPEHCAGEDEASRGGAGVA